MSIQGNIISSGSIGLFPVICVTAPSGSTIDVLLNSVIIDSYTLSETETEHNFVIHNFSANTYTVRGTKGSESKQQNVMVERSQIYTVTILYSFNLTYHFASASELNNFNLNVPSSSTINTTTFDSCDCLRMYDTVTDVICSFSSKGFKTLYPCNDCYRFKMRYYYTGKTNWMDPQYSFGTDKDWFTVRPMDYSSGWTSYLPYKASGFYISDNAGQRYKGSIISTGAWHTAEVRIEDGATKIYSDDVLLFTENTYEHHYLTSMGYSLKQSWWNTQFTVYVDYIMYDFK